LNHEECNSIKFNKIALKICSDIYRESTFIYPKLDIMNELNDLFLEQIFLCAFSGFNEFLQNKWISSILNMQMTSGCFSYDKIKCSPHMNGLGAASLAFFGKTLDKMYN
jgi:hypothetical protein